MKKILLGFAAFAFVGVALFTTLPNASAGYAEEGFWKSVDDETGKVTAYWQFWVSGGNLYGKIVKVPGQSDDVKCSVCKGWYKNKPVVGTAWLKLTEYNDGTWEEGFIIDSGSGKQYDAKVWVEGGKLKVRGYIGFVYRTQTWLRTSDPR